MPVRNALTPWSCTLFVLLASCGGDKTGLSSGVLPLPTSPTAPAPPGPSADGLNGSYELTFNADASSCSNLPAALLSRRYVGRFTESAVAYLYGARFFGGPVYGNWNVVYVSAASGSLWFHDPPLWESLSDDSYLVIYGGENGPVPSDGTATFWATYEYCTDRQQDVYPKCAVTPVTCFSLNHQLAVHPR